MSAPIPRPAPVTRKTFLSVIFDVLDLSVPPAFGDIISQAAAGQAEKSRLEGVLTAHPCGRDLHLAWTHGQPRGDQGFPPLTPGEDHPGASRAECLCAEPAGAG